MNNTNTNSSNNRSSSANNENKEEDSSPHKNSRFDVSHTMDRLKQGFVGGTPSKMAHPSEHESSFDEHDAGHGNGTGTGTGHELDADADDYEIGLHYQHYLHQNDQHDKKRRHRRTTKTPTKTISQTKCVRNLLNGLHQVPAVALIAMFHLMIGIPFGVSYFPIGWREASATASASASAQDNTEIDAAIEDGVHGTFPIAGKDALGIRMFLFSTIIGQLVFTFTSGFNNPISLQMVENVPFCQTLAQIVISHAGYGMTALSTLMFMFGLSSVVVGAVFYILGRMQLGRVIYFFPTHVLVGCIAGIGLFIVKTGVEVTINNSLSGDNLMESMHLFSVVLAFEVLLRILEKINLDQKGKTRFALLSPIYFCMITPAFYGVLRLIRVSVDDAMNMGYFFPSLEGSSDNVTTETASSLMDVFKKSIFKDDLMDMWRVIDFTNISWPAVVDSIPTLIALSLFSLIHVPINIPAFSISTNQEADMNKELMSHGYSNICAGMCGGLQNYMAYTQSVLYAKSGGQGKPSGIAVAIVTSALFFIGPTIASYIPRCMAGTLLLHVGIDLFLEGE